MTVSRPVGGILSTGRLPGSGWVAIHLCGLPGDIGRASRPTLGLAPGGVCRAVRVAPDAGALLPHRFTLACAGRSPVPPSAVCSLLHCPAGHPDWPLASTLPCGAPTFLDTIESCRGHPAGSPSPPFSHGLALLFAKRGADRLTPPIARIDAGRLRTPASTARGPRRGRGRGPLASGRGRRDGRGRRRCGASTWRRPR